MFKFQKNLSLLHMTTLIFCHHAFAEDSFYCEDIKNPQNTCVVFMDSEENENDDFFTYLAWGACQFGFSKTAYSFPDLNCGHYRYQFDRYPNSTQEGLFCKSRYSRLGSVELSDLNFAASKLLLTIRATEYAPSTILMECVSNETL